MHMKRVGPLWLAGLLVVLLLGGALFVTHARAADPKYQWDILSVDFAAGTLNAGGIASALANDGSKITLTGEGTFNTASHTGSADVTGGGTWQTFDTSGAPTASGTYQVTSFVSFTLAPGDPPPLRDTIGIHENIRGGLLVVTVQFSDESTGVLTVSCHLFGPSVPPSVFEGITVSKGFTDYWNRQAPPAPPGDANRTNFHILNP